jgi:hypothetical protein
MCKKLNSFKKILDYHPTGMVEKRHRMKFGEKECE